MNIKLSGIVAAGMLAMMAIAPLGLAHDASISGNTNPTGNYVGAAGPWVSIDGDDLAAGNALCDLEILSDGDVSTPDDNFLDEPSADGTATSGTTQAEGDWDDGGFGAVCHTPNTHYVTAGFNTQDCAYSNAVATDAIFTASSGAVDVWASTGCDWITNVPSATDPSLVDFALDAANCAVNAVITSNPGEIVTACVDRVTDCLLAISLDGTTDTCPAGAGGQACGPDGGIDGGNEGAGSAGVAYPSTYPYAPTPTTSGSCAATDAVASVFLWSAVEVDTVAQTVTPYLASTGSVA